jgi:DNA-binding NtrC family response regulator
MLVWELLALLREIREDIPLLANSLLATYCQEMKKETKKMNLIS